MQNQRDFNQIIAAHAKHDANTESDTKYVYDKGKQARIDGIAGIKGHIPIIGKDYEMSKGSWPGTNSFNNKGG